MRCRDEDCHGMTTVVDSREQVGAVKVRRRRECMLCKERFTTYESEPESWDEEVLEDMRQRVARAVSAMAASIPGARRECIRVLLRGLDLKQLRDVTVMLANYIEQAQASEMEAVDAG